MEMRKVVIIEVEENNFRLFPTLLYDFLSGLVKISLNPLTFKSLSSPVMQ